MYTKFGSILSILCQDIEQNEILASINGRNYVANLQKMTLYIPNIDIIDVNAHTKLCPFILKILRGNEIMTSIKGNNSVANVQKIMLYNPNLDLINVNVYTKFG